MRIAICDVGPRDGLQNDPKILEPETRAELVNRLARAGLPRIEAVSFVNPERVPQMAGAEQVVAAIERASGVVYAGLVLNEKGYDRLAETSLDEVHFTFAATETFNMRNANATVEESMQMAERIVALAHANGRRATVTIGASFGCPFEGKVDPRWILDLAARLVEAAPDEIVFADTIGVAVPSQVTHVVSEGVKLGMPVALHGHNTRNTGFVNAYAAIEAGATALDASVGGLGGCPFAPNATGNVATEDLLYMLSRSGFETGIDLGKLIETARWLQEQRGKPVPSMVSKAGGFPKISAA